MGPTAMLGKHLAQQRDMQGHLVDSMDSGDRPKAQAGNKEGFTRRLVRTRPPGMAIRFGLSWSLLRQRLLLL